MGMPRYIAITSRAICIARIDCENNFHLLGKSCAIPNDVDHSGLNDLLTPTERVGDLHDRRGLERTSDAGNKPHLGHLMLYTRKDTRAA